MERTTERHGPGAAARLAGARDRSAPLPAGAMVSVIVASRREGNMNPAASALTFLESLEQSCASPDNFEVLFKFDDDDRISLTEVIPRLDAFPFRVKYVVTPRGRGYVDIHQGYNDLFFRIAERSQVVGLLADDTVARVPRWDALLLEKARVHPDGISVLHGTETSLEAPVDELIERPDSFSFWSRRWLQIVGGFPHLASIDGWSALLDRALYQGHGLDRRVFLGEALVERRMEPGLDQGELSACGTSADAEAHARAVFRRWYVERSLFLAFMKSRALAELVEQQALNIALNVAHAAGRARGDG